MFLLFLRRCLFLNSYKHSFAPRSLAEGFQYWMHHDSLCMCVCALARTHQTHTYLIPHLSTYQHRVRICPTILYEGSVDHSSDRRKKIIHPARIFKRCEYKSKASRINICLTELPTQFVFRGDYFWHQISTIANPFALTNNCFPKKLSLMFKGLYYLRSR